MSTGPPPSLVAVNRVQSPMCADADSAATTPCTPPPAQQQQQQQHEQSSARPSLAHYVGAALFEPDMQPAPEFKAERVKNFVSLPWELEKLLFFGYTLCADCFLQLFTLFPIRLLLALCGCSSSWLRGRSPRSAHVVDLCKGSLLVCACYLLSYFDSSILYHSIRGQCTYVFTRHRGRQHPFFALTATAAMMKLYVVFNLLEVCDKLCCSFGMDILDSLYTRLRPDAAPRQPPQKLNVILHYALAVGYMLVHAVVFLYQAVTLNVAVNSHNALLSLLISNQFVEIKSNVFKRFEAENLFQLSCSDIVERFNLSTFLAINVARNFLELSGNAVGTAPQVTLWVPVGLVHVLSAAVEMLARFGSALADVHTLSAVFVSWSHWAIRVGANATMSMQLFHDYAMPLLANVTQSVPERLVSNGQSLWDWTFTVALPQVAVQSQLTSVTFALPAITRLMWTVISPALVMMGSEVLVDWLKHAFITKFNGVRPNIYKRYRDVFSRDVVQGLSDTPDNDGSDTDCAPVASSQQQQQQQRRSVDMVPYVTRKIGFASLPLAAMVVHMGIEIMHMAFSESMPKWGVVGTLQVWRADWIPADEGFARRLLDLVDTYSAVLFYAVVIYLSLLSLKVGLGYTILDLCHQRHAQRVVDEDATAATATSQQPVQHTTVDRMVDLDRGISSSTVALNVDAMPLQASRDSISMSLPVLSSSRSLSLEDPAAAAPTVTTTTPIAPAPVRPKSTPSWIVKQPKIQLPALPRVPGMSTGGGGGGGRVVGKISHGSDGRLQAEEELVEKLQTIDRYSLVKSRIP
ncbi:hypothetical protein RI367_001674 [Sorochytrium milnesiophthora]